MAFHNEACVKCLNSVKNITRGRMIFQSITSAIYKLGLKIIRILQWIFFSILQHLNQELSF